VVRRIPRENPKTRKQKNVTTYLRPAGDLLEPGGVAFGDQLRLLDDEDGAERVRGRDGPGAARGALEGGDGVLKVFFFLIQVVRFF